VQSASVVGTEPRRLLQREPRAGLDGGQRGPDEVHAVSYGYRANLA
jgi:hypothetical protein